MTEREILIEIDKLCQNNYYDEMAKASKERRKGTRAGSTDAMYYSGRADAFAEIAVKIAELARGGNL